MQEFHIAIRSFQQAREFVKLAMSQPFEILVGNDLQRINGKDLMGIFSLDHTRPLRVSANCPEEEFLRFRQEAAGFVMKY